MSLPYSFLLAAALVWTILFSLTATPEIRGYRNLGGLACYVIFGVMLFREPVTSALTTWAAFGVAGGLSYVVYELISRTRSRSGTDLRVSLAHIPYGLLAWPIMAPEAIEYSAATLGMLPRVPLLATNRKRPRNAAVLPRTFSS